jgi:hypothetical protein
MKAAHGQNAKPKVRSCFQGLNYAQNAFISWLRTWRHVYWVYVQHTMEIHRNTGDLPSVTLRAEDVPSDIRQQQTPCDDRRRYTQHSDNLPVSLHNISFHVSVLYLISLFLFKIKESNGDPCTNVSLDQTVKIRPFWDNWKANVGIVPQINPQPFPSTSYPIIHSLIILSRDATQTKALDTSLIKPQIKNLNHETFPCR